MRQEEIVLRLRPPDQLAVKPMSYLLPSLHWYWCNLHEFCALIPAIAATRGNEFAPSPEQLVSNFAGLIRLNRSPEGETNEPKVKVFRIAFPGGTIVTGNYVPTSPNEAPPFEPFRLEGVDDPYPDDLFVPEGWVVDVSSAILKGAIAAADFPGGPKVGYGPGGQAVILDNKIGQGPFIVRVPKLPVL